MPDHPSSPYRIAGRAAAEAVLEHGRDGARLRPASDAFLLSRIARAVVDALNVEYVIKPRGKDWTPDELHEHIDAAAEDGERVCNECYAVNDEVPFTGHCWSCGERL